MDATVESEVTLQIPDGYGSHPERRVTRMCVSCNAVYIGRIFESEGFASRLVWTVGDFGRCWGYNGRCYGVAS